jgi:hypothetical protein
MHTQQQYLECPSWRLTSTAGGANNNQTVTSAPQGHEYSMLQWQQQQQQRPHRQQQTVSSMDGFYAYCFDRGNGTYTRLIPADMIPPLMNIPATQMGCEGMLVLPLPLRPPPYGPASNIEPVTVLKVRAPCSYQLLPVCRCVGDLTIRSRPLLRPLSPVLIPSR